MDHVLPVPLHRPGARRYGRGRLSGAHGPVARPDGRQRGLDALLQQGAQLLRRAGHRRRPGAGGHGLGLREQVQDAARRAHAGGHRVLRRRRGEPGPNLGVHEHGRVVEITDDLLHREQPVRHGHVHLEVVVQQRLLHDGERHPRAEDGALPCENKNSRHRRDGLFPHRTA